MRLSRHTLNEFARQAPAWLKRQVDSAWFDHYSVRTSKYLLPKQEAERQARGTRWGRDGLFLLEQVYAGRQHPELSALPCGETLRADSRFFIRKTDKSICASKKKILTALGSAADLPL